VKTTCVTETKKYAVNEMG